MGWEITIDKDKTKEYYSKTLMFGTVLATVISWSVHESIVWACIHGFLGWFYVIYYALTRPIG